MKKISNLLLTETKWLILSLVLTFFSALIIFGRSIFSEYVDLHIHDTYLVISALFFTLPLFFLINFLIYFIRTLKYRFSNSIINLILLLSGLLLILFISLLIHTIPPQFQTGWTVYPPLSGLKENSPSLFDQARIIISGIALIIQVFISVILLYTTYRWWKARQ